MGLSAPLNAQQRAAGDLDQNNVLNVPMLNSMALV